MTPEEIYEKINERYSKYITQTLKKPTSDMEYIISMMMCNIIIHSDLEILVSYHIDTPAYFASTFSLFLNELGTVETTQEYYVNSKGVYYGADAVIHHLHDFLDDIELHDKTRCIVCSIPTEPIIN